MPYSTAEGRQAYQRAYYAHHRKLLRRRARLRQRVARETETLWHSLPEPQGFCSAMAQKAINEAGGILPLGLEKEDVEQEIAMALVNGKAASQCCNPHQYAATLAIRVAQRLMRKVRQ